MNRKELKSSGKGYCRYGKHGPRKLYRIESNGRLLGHACYDCVVGLAGDSRPPERKRNPQKLP